MFLRSLTDYNSTSVLFNKGKIKFVKNSEKCHDLHESAKKFKNVTEDQ